MPSWHPVRPECERRLAVIRRVWPQIDDLAAANVVPDALLFAEMIDATAVVDAALAAAEQRLARRAAS